MKKCRSLPLLVAVLTLSLAGFALNGAALAQDTIKLGVAGPHSGDLASYGIPTTKAAELVVKDINAKGGVLGKQVQLVVEDDVCKPEVATNTATKLTSDKVPLVLGHICSFRSALQQARVVAQLPAFAVARPRPQQGHVEGLVVDGLGDEIGGVQLQGADGQVHFAEGGGHDDLDVGMPGLEGFEDLDPVHFGHAHVGDDDLGRHLFDPPQPSGSVFGRGDPVTGVFQGDGHHLADVGFVVDQNDRPAICGVHPCLPSGCNVSSSKSLSGPVSVSTSGPKPGISFPSPFGDDFGFGLDFDWHAGCIPISSRFGAPSPSVRRA